MGLLDVIEGAPNQTGYARRAYVKITYNGTDITKELASYLKFAEYTDVISGQADDLQLTLEDREGLWLSDWFPDKGAVLTASIVAKYWESPNDAGKELPLGLFEIDEIECSAMPSEAKLKAVSVPNNTTLRGEEHTRAWEKYTVQKIAYDIASMAGLELAYQAEENPTIDRVEQTEQSDLSFMNKLCEDNGLSLKITDKKMVIFDLKQLESADPVLLFKRPTAKDLAHPEVQIVSSNSIQSPLKELKPASWTFSSGTRDIYKACTVEYTDPNSKTKISYTFADPDKKEGKTLMVKQEVKSQAEAETLAKKELRKKNSEEVKGSLSVMGDPDLSSGLTVNVEGFGHFDGKYIISSVKHALGGGYKCSVEIRRCLNGY